MKIQGLLVVLLMAFSIVAVSQDETASAPVEFRIGHYEASGDKPSALVEGFGRPFYLADQVVLGIAQLVSVKIKLVANRPVIKIIFNADGKETLAAVTRDNIGRPLAVLLDSKVISAPVIGAPNNNGVLEISGDFTPEQATRLAFRIVGG